MSTLGFIIMSLARGRRRSRLSRGWGTSRWVAKGRLRESEQRGIRPTSGPGAPLQRSLSHFCSALVLG